MLGKCKKIRVSHTFYTEISYIASALCLPLAVGAGGAQSPTLKSAGAEHACVHHAAEPRLHHRLLRGTAEGRASDGQEFAGYILVGEEK